MPGSRQFHWRGFTTRYSNVLTVQPHIKLRSSPSLGTGLILVPGLSSTSLFSASSSAMNQTRRCSRLSPASTRLWGPIPEGDSDLESTLGIIDRIFGRPDLIPWQDFSFTTSHHAWMSHILLYRAQHALKGGSVLPDDVREFVLHSLRLSPPPPTSIVTDCLFIIGLVLGIKLHPNDLLVTDKR